MNRRKIAALTLGLMTLGSTSFAAQALEDHSQQAQELAQPAPAQPVENKTPMTSAQQDIRFHVANLSVESEVKIPAKVIRQATKDFQDKEITFSDLNRVTDALTKYVRTHGTPAATAYVPAQASADGVIKVKVTAGRIGKINLDDKSRLRESAARTVMARLKPGEVITTKDLETVLYTINQLGGVQAVGLLSPGTAFGTSDVTIRIREGKDDAFMLYTENYGSKAAGRYRLGAIYNRAQMNGIGDSMQLSGLVSNENLHNYGVRYQTLAGHSGSTVGLAASRMTYDLGDDFANLDATGKANTYSAFGKTPFYTTTNGGLGVTYGLDYRELEDDVDSFGYNSEKESWVGHLGLEGYRRLGKSLWNYDATGYHGKLTMESDIAKTLNETTRTAGDFTKGVYNVRYQQGYDQHWDSVLKVQAQQASKNLDSSEQMYLGGVSGVRAYTQGSGSGDVGALGSFELRYHPNVRNLTLSTYYDMGHVRARKDGQYGDTGYTLKGWGLGVTYAEPENYFLRLDYARRIGFDRDLTDNSAKDKGRFWFMAGKIW